MVWTYWHRLRNVHAIASPRPRNQKDTKILSLAFCLEYDVLAFLCLVSFLVFVHSFVLFCYILHANIYVPFAPATIRGESSSLRSEFCVLYRWSSVTSIRIHILISCPATIRYGKTSSLRSEICVLLLLHTPEYYVANTGGALIACRYYRGTSGTRCLLSFHL